MKKITLLTIIFFFNSGFLISQVGINTNNPIDDLHLGSTSSTIRLEGLNSTNNSANDGLTDKRVYVDNNGTLLIKDDAPELAISELGNLTVPTSITVTTNSGSKTSATLTTGNFTVNGNHWINLIVNIGAKTIRNNTGGEINDSKAKIIGIEIYIDSILISTNSQTYLSTTNSGTIPDGTIYLTSDYFKLLTTGIHTYEIKGYVEGGGSIQATFGGDNMDKIQIIEFK